MNRFAGSALIALLVAFSVSVIGCSPKTPDTPKSLTKSGVITNVDVANKRVKMKMRDTKDPTKFQEKQIDGTITPETEIIINGVRSELKDLRVDDNVEAVGHTEGSGENMKIIAEEIRVDRAEMVSTAADENKTNDTTTTPPEGADARVAQMMADLKSRLAATKAAREELLKGTAVESDLEVVRLDNEIRTLEAQIKLLEKHGVAAIKDPTLLDPTAQKVANRTAPQPDELVRMLYQELKRQRQNFLTQREELISKGMAADHPEVVELDNKIRRADENIARVEDEVAKKGSNIDLNAPTSIPSTQPVGGN